MGRDAATELALSRLHFPVTTLGPGRRAGVWFQGCSIRCPGCLSLDTWDERADSNTVSTNTVVDWLRSLAPKGIEGITISGGEPFDQAPGLRNLLFTVRSVLELTDVDILIYSGYAFSRLRRVHADTLAFADAVISGPYVAGRPTDLRWRGSSNQRLALLTDRAVDRYGAAQTCERSLQVSADGGQLWITGIPRPGDLDQFEAILAAKGVALGEISWRA